MCDVKTRMSFQGRLRDQVDNAINELHLLSGIDVAEVQTPEKGTAEKMMFSMKKFFSKCAHIY